MKIRIVLASAVVAGAFSLTAIAISGVLSKEPVPPAIAEATLWTPDSLSEPQIVETNSVRSFFVQADDEFRFAPLLPLPVALADAPMPSIEPPLVTWSREIASGETLDAVLSDAGLDASDRAEIALAIGAEYDLRRLRPGHAITVVSTTDGTPRRVELAVEDSIRIETVFGEQLATRVLKPDPEMVTFAAEAVIESSVFAALDKAGIPARFAVDMAQMLGGTVDFRRELSGGETMRLFWREARDGNERIGQPELAFAALNLGETVYEIVWPDDGSGKAMIYVDGEVLRVFAQPVEGARLSSVFGRRTHPVYGNVRMHTGVDFAATRGTPVKATAPGRVSFIGRRGGYGRVVEIAHGSATLTRYAHLSEVPDTLEQGQRVMAGDMIGRVGATGTATGPNLHYEVLVDGRPTDPLSDDRLAEAAERDADDTAALERLAEARALLAERLTSEFVQTTTERL
ncbi:MULTISPECIES: M23 family metallopeptidase [Alphaproteobacteria]|jgi:murein DD-endopeptidase MepM/ murein hydrolase activator NlpD|uniref:Peptidase family M23 n=2 Tax=Rhodobacterales TaxID=204455 RepID=A0A1H3DZY9_9RHOB|nr:MULTISPECIES: M23 family metallopeptidase [Rhodobacterales]MBB5723429.1 murein DD-endopeptidase MepM/ murein hydrolase activator NlpD [Yoonia ponticola]MCP3877590.1 M23 family metallopeptidase [Sulfitobacter sp.]SDX71608.1 Peptidase family M23 [Sulfitobacter pontiacus]|tara:strand:- start:9119 stop:10492 length:1374 start_codon:yes stop_codon:yes gene_type:complete